MARLRCLVAEKQDTWVLVSVPVPSFDAAVRQLVALVKPRRNYVVDNIRAGALPSSALQALLLTGPRAEADAGRAQAYPRALWSTFELQALTDMPRS